ncbi:MAG: DUF4260 domain-containing protein [Balneolaceae bacterium]|nr:DUF4260 domain-containing protein [Balneolaceae bacterium]
MKSIIQLEELGMFILSFILFTTTGYSWWIFIVFLLVPDISMIGYVVNARIGAILYNMVHHKGVAILVYLVGFYLGDFLIQMVGTILFAHSSMDRIFGYGLKYMDDFKHTHLGWNQRPKRSWSIGLGV